MVAGQGAIAANSGLIAGGAQRHSLVSGTFNDQDYQNNKVAMMQFNPPGGGADIGAHTFHYQQPRQQVHTEGDEQNATVPLGMGGSFDSRERVREIRERHLAAQIPASKVSFKKSHQMKEAKGMKTGTLRASAANAAKALAGAGSNLYHNTQDGRQSQNQANAAPGHENYADMAATPGQFASTHTELNVHNLLKNNYTRSSKVQSAQPDNV